MNAKLTDLLLQGKKTEWVKKVSEELIQFWGNFGKRRDPDLFDNSVLFPPTIRPTDFNFNFGFSGSKFTLTSG